MNSTFNKKTACLAIVTLTCGSLFFSPAQSSESESECEEEIGVVVIVNADNEIDDIRMVDLKRIYFGRTIRWDNGEIIQKATLKRGTRIKKFWLSSVLNVTEREFQQVWLKNIFTGKADPPESFITTRQLLKFVSENPQAIGFVSNTDSLLSTVKAITIDSLTQLK